MSLLKKQQATQIGWFLPIIGVVVYSVMILSNSCSVFSLTLDLQPMLRFSSIEMEHINYVPESQHAWKQLDHS